jgi:(2Fe-2S) ferredoxin
MTKKYASATEKNRQPILEILKKSIPPTGNILEVASGSGEHSLFFAPHFPQQKWIPSDKEKECLDSIKAWRQDCLTDNLQSPLMIDVVESNWYQGLTNENINAIVCINMIHISPWETCLGLMTGAGKILPPDGILYLYGAYKINNQHTAPSNQEFDWYLRSQNSAWGVRNLDDVVEVAEKKDLIFEKKVSMPSNNFSLIFRKIS